MLMDELTCNIMHVSLFLCSDVKIVPIEIMSWFHNAHQAANVHYTIKATKPTFPIDFKDKHVRSNVPKIPTTYQKIHDLVELFIALPTTF